MLFLYFLGILISGALVGWIAGKLMKNEGGLLRNILIGIAGSTVGSVIFDFLGFYAHGFFASLLVSVAGACLLIWLVQKPRR